MSVTTADVVVVGGGGVGSSVAYFLTSLNPQLRVVVCERDPTYSRASTALAAGGIRQMFSTPENVLMSQFGLEFVGSADETLAIGEDRPALGLKDEHYLRLLPETARPVVSDQLEMQRGLGAFPILLEPGDLKRRFPWMNVEDLGFGVLGGGGEGVFDPYALLQALRRKAMAQGAIFLAGEVVSLQVDHGRSVRSVAMANGDIIACGRVVNAAGPRAAAVSAMVGLPLPVRPFKALTFAFRSQVAVADLPVTLDHVQGINIKPEGELYLAAWGREDEPKHPEDFEIDLAQFEQEVWGRLAHRSASFNAVKLARAWVGHIEVNTFDANPVLGPHPAIENFIFANGFSGHGVQHIPAAGRGIAEWMTFGAYRTLDLARFGYQRLLDGTPLRETV